VVDPTAEQQPAVHVRPATREDVPLLLRMFAELAEYEHLEHVLVADEQRLAGALFGEPPAAQALIAHLGDEVAGYAVFYSTFSTFLAIQGVWLEDLFVRPEARKHGVGRALLAGVAAALVQRGGERLEWSALHWNELALGFYRSLGAEQMNDWITHRLIGEPLRALADETPR
jgi:GNAT superfamily N-acetyltransferase